MEGSSTALEAIQEHRHQASVYPSGHTNIQLADVVFFKIGDTLWERRPQAFSNLYLGVLDHNSLFGHQIVADLFAQMVFHINMDNQSCKDKRLPPHVFFSETRHRHTTGNPNLRIGFILSLG
ncbi:hypothetical protein DSO57_1007684 [Entomophthora muscae]|uniref:Uncharacterized protein n=1 Tax=Entomophthora muscae TaxID=34485 RepID=A0ACC2U4Y4_9FUNG|nr:hypothetical protein DSO57_1007684 [Entomophthora muscae]